VREHQFLAATANTGYGFERVKGFGSIMLGNQGFFVDHFTGGARARLFGYMPTEMLSTSCSQMERQLMSSLAHGYIVIQLSPMSRN
jgi:uncharacterized protein (AIM24 family)